MPEPAQTTGPPLEVRLAILGLTLVGLGAIVAQATLDAEDAESLRVFQWRDALPLAVFVTAFAAAVAIAVAARPRPFSPREWRRLLGSAATWIWMAGVFVPDRLLLGKVTAVSVACAVWAAWAWLGPRVKPRSPAATRWFNLLAALLTILAAAPWLAFAWMYAS
jgi:hypothetical protein